MDKSTKTKNILYGMGSILDLIPAQQRRRRGRRQLRKYGDWQAAWQALCLDGAKVGRDMTRALRKFHIASGVKDD